WAGEATPSVVRRYPGMLARDAELLGHRRHRLADRWQHILAQQRAGMRGLAVVNASPKQTCAGLSKALRSQISRHRFATLSQYNGLLRRAAASDGVSEKRTTLSTKSFSIDVLGCFISQQEDGITSLEIIWNFPDVFDDE